MSTPATAPIVVGVDGSASSRLALAWAVHLAALEHARVDAVMVRQPLRTYADPRAATHRLLVDTVQQTFGDERPEGLRLRVVDGKPADELLARSIGAMVLVVGSRGHSGVIGRLLGSVSARCTEQAVCPVLVAHSRPPARHSDRGPYTRIIVGVDGSASSRAALRWAAAYAARVCGHLEAVLVWNPGDLLGTRFGSPPSALTAQEWMDSWLAELVDTVLGPARAAGLRLTAERGQAATILLRRSRQATLLVLGTRGHRGFENLALGSVSAKCAAQARCAVVVVHDLPAGAPRRLAPDSSEVA